MTVMAMKVYDLQWFTTYGMDYEVAAAALVADGVDTVLTQNRLDPLPSSGVDQRAYLNRYGNRLRAYDDRRWSRALREAGLRVYQSTATFFDPLALKMFPDARPINALGDSDIGFDWYVGLCPTHEPYLEWKIERVRRVVTELEPDGLFLQFTRFPGFWENWTWNPQYQFTGADRWCFCERCLQLFQTQTGRALPAGNIRDQAAFILNSHPHEWFDWRCSVLAKLIERIAHDSSAAQHGLDIMLNTLPFPSSDFAGLDVRRTIAGQDFRTLEGIIDGFELMTYLQILNRPVSWMIDVVNDVRRQIQGDARIFCTLQACPLYIDGIHAGRNRSADISASELREAGIAALRAGAGGLVFYHWTDFLEDEANGGEKRKVLRELATTKERTA